MDFHKLVKAAAGLISEEAENSEYDRALVELVCDASGYGLTDEDKGTVEKIIRAEAAKNRVRS